MSRDGNKLPQLGGGMFITDSGLAEYLMFKRDTEVPHGAAIDTLRRMDGADLIEDYFAPYFEIARARGVGFIMETPTWRASPDWCQRAGFANLRALGRANREAVDLAHRLRRLHKASRAPIVVSGCIGPRDEQYVAQRAMNCATAAAYHNWQVDILARSQVDLVTAMSMTNVDEAIGVTRAAERHGTPIAVSFAVTADGCLVSGQRLNKAIEQLDAETSHYASYAMIECAPTCDGRALFAARGAWRQRIRGVRFDANWLQAPDAGQSHEANAGSAALSELSDDVARAVAAMCELSDTLNVFGGICGTQQRQLEAVISHFAKARAAKPRKRREQQSGRGQCSVHE